MGTNNIVLIHGLWMTPLSWEYWANHYTERGYSVYAPSWPGMERDVRALRRAPESYADIGFKQIVDHYEKLVIDLEHAPILIGHSFGGLVVQALLDRGLGCLRRGHRIGPHQGNLDTSLLHDARGHAAVVYDAQPPLRPALTPAQFHYAFMNTSSREESFPLYQRYAVPGPDACCCRPSSRTSIRSPKPRSTRGGTIARRCC